MTLDIDQFPSLRAAARNDRFFEQSFNAIAQGIESGSIRNVDYQDAKQYLGRAADEAWKNKVAGPFFYGGAYKDQPEPVEELHNSIMIMSLHDVISTAKKVERYKGVENEATAAMRAYVKEVLPLAQAVASLKDKVVKGRAPNQAPAKPVNPNKVVKTCPCCFRPIAVVGSTMAHHGYRRPGHGHQTSSCPGINFKPLEVSSEGLEWLISQYEQDLQNLEKSLANIGNITKLTNIRNRKVFEVSKGDPEWEKYLGMHRMGIETDIRHTQATLNGLRPRLAAWEPAP